MESRRHEAQPVSRHVLTGSQMCNRLAPQKDRLERRLSTYWWWVMIEKRVRKRDDVEMLKYVNRVKPPFFLRQKHTFYTPKSSQSQAVVDAPRRVIDRSAGQDPSLLVDPAKIK